MNFRVREVERLRTRLDRAFTRVRGLPASTDTELSADLARYLCVLVAGFVETSLFEFVSEHARTRAQPQIQRFVESRTRRIQNVKFQKLCDLMGAFSSAWRIDLEAFADPEQRDALNSVVSTRNEIAHGGSVGITFAQLEKHYKKILKLLSHCESKFV